MIHHVNRQKGFTLIELMIALAFVGFILIFATTAVIQVMQTYNKGLAVKQINQSGRTTLETLSRFLRAADPGSVNVDVMNSQRRLCLGTVSYIWNLYNTPNNQANKYDDGSPLTFARMNDPSNSMCTQTAGAYPSPSKIQSVDILQSNVWVMAISVSDPSPDAPLTDISISLAVANDPAITAGQCARGGSQGQFCATSNFATTVITGGGK